MVHCHDNKQRDCDKKNILTIQRSESSSLDLRLVDEDVLRTIIRGDESISLDRIEEFNSSSNLAEVLAQHKFRSRECGFDQSTSEHDITC